MIPKKIYLNYVDEDDFENDVEITWCVDPVCVEDCDMQNREYTDLSQVWHDAEEEPQTGRQIVAINGEGVSFSGVYWPYNAKGYVPKYPGVYWIGGGCMDGARLLDWQEAVKWAYIEDLLPKGGEKLPNTRIIQIKSWR